MKRVRALLVLALLAGTGVIAYAQRYGGGSDIPYCYTPDECPRAPYDGRFTFLRMYFETRGGGGFGRGFGGGGEPPWHHDRPEAERNLSAILREITTLRTFDGPTGGNVLGLGDADIFRHPIVWVSEPGYWVPTDEEVKTLRAYLLKGGFMIFDDFDSRQGHADNLIMQLQRVVPELKPMPLDGTEAIWKSFFEVNPNALQLRLNARPQYWGLFEDNDRTKRQLVIMNVDNDIGEYMEYSATGFAPVDITNEAYKLAVNYIIYALVH